MSINLLQVLMHIETDRSHIFCQHYIGMRPSGPLAPQRLAGLQARAWDGFCVPAKSSVAACAVRFSSPSERGR